MGKSTPQAPAAPNPFATASAQTASNKETAVANSIVGNANEISPFGNVNYEIAREINGMPQWTRITSLSPGQQQLYDQQTQLGSSLNSLAQNQVNRLTNHLGQPVNTDGLPDGGDNRARVEQALFDRINPQLDRSKEALRTQLENQGFQLGSEGFDKGMDESNRARNDALLAVTAAGGTEAQLASQMRERALQERLAMRNQPINEITALMAGGQVNVPQFSPFKGGTVDPTQVGNMVYQSAALNNQNYQNQLQSQAAGQAGLYSGLGSLVGGGLFRFSDRRLKRDILDTGIRLMNGLKVYQYRYTDTARRMVGLMADEVQKIRPRAVQSIGGYLAVNYAAATER
jgi:hypothetical protein